MERNHAVFHIIAALKTLIIFLYESYKKIKPSTGDVPISKSLLKCFIPMHY